MLDAAISIIASGGSRGLTHRAVDRHLGIAEGCTSRHFRTREALVSGAVARMVELDLKATDAVQLRATSRSEAARRIVSMVEAAVAPANRDRQLARYELGLEAARRTPLRDAFAGNRDLFLGQAERLLRDAGCPDPHRTAPALAVFINGVILDRVLHRQPAIQPEDLADHIRHFLGDAEPPH
jgi:DNA-binding transcriptional regulator YbjK